MHCQATEAFIHQQNPDMLADTSPAVDTGFAVDGDYNSISCAACHAVHANWSDSSPAMIRAETSAELCGLCHTGGRHSTYQVWSGGSHDLAGVECIDCHGYDLHPDGEGGWTAFLNHTFAVNLSIACDQPGICHEGMETWALGQLEATQDAFHELTEEISDAADAFETVVLAYNETAGANLTITNAAMDAIDTATGAVAYYGYDGSEGFHDSRAIFEGLNDAYVTLLEGQAAFYEAIGEGDGAVAPPPDMLIIIAGAGGGIVLGLVLGILVGRRR